MSSDAIDVIVLAGGLGTRLRSVVPDLPKPLAPVGERPFLDILLAQLAGFSCVRKVVLAIGYKAGSFLERYQGDRRFGFEIDFSVEDAPAGTGGALLQALGKTHSEGVLAMNGDSFVDFSLPELQCMYDEKRSALAMVIRKVENVSRYGSVDWDASTGKVRAFREKAAADGPGYVNAGVYLVRRSRFPPARATPQSLETDLLPSMLGDIHAIAVDGNFIDIGLPETYAVAGSYLR